MICTNSRSGRAVRDWNFWEWLAYGSLWVAGMIEAAGGAMLRAREVRRRLPRVLRSHNWAFLPLGLLSVATIILAWNAITGEWPHSDRRAKTEQQELDTVRKERDSAREELTSLKIHSAELQKTVTSLKQDLQNLSKTAPAQPAPHFGPINTLNHFSEAGAVWRQLLKEDASILITGPAEN
jgi:hypothetical protein